MTPREAQESWVGWASRDAEVDQGVNKTSESSDSPPSGMGDWECESRNKSECSNGSKRVGKWIIESSGWK